jgi:hypothetical protein
VEKYGLAQRQNGVSVDSAQESDTASRVFRGYLEQGYAIVGDTVVSSGDEAFHLTIS